MSFFPHQRLNRAMTYCLHLGCFNCCSPVVPGSDLRWEELDHTKELLNALNWPHEEVPTLLDHMRIGAKLSIPERIQRFINKVTELVPCLYRGISCGSPPLPSLRLHDRHSEAANEPRALTWVGLHGLFARLVQARVPLLELPNRNSSVQA